jgi:hypothetical protein
MSYIATSDGKCVVLSVALFVLSMRLANKVTTSIG